MAAQAVGAGLSLAGNLVGALGSASAARKQNRILGEGVKQQSRAGMESTSTMGDFISQLRGSQPNPATERAAFTQALGTPTVSALPTASARFRTDATGAASAAQGYGRNLADLFARIRAPGLQRQSESELLMNMSNALQPIQARAQDDQFLTQLRAGMTQQNPWVGLLSQGLSNAGAALSSGQGGW